MKKADRKKIGNRVRTHMRVKGYGVPELASATKLSQKTIYKILSGERGMSIDSARIIAKKLDITVGALLD